eukprot:CAMPEP_0201655836 /NCGR_PEP_ID=MMETSP0493-20130528/46219_1 /ASSEMBLY_ACC=CAM_ASM_000838 /TAXON_ID=420259 /ORGANISM="Thalassiosira gravida, Strain GMp14c1" /LENGTH=111 /DNA_ID=CAMNT_0048132435 /DNA_START=244 /DNA_END=579 /DNA_ORIENTATION=-
MSSPSDEEEELISTTAVILDLTGFFFVAFFLPLMGFLALPLDLPLALVVFAVAAFALVACDLAGIQPSSSVVATGFLKDDDCLRFVFIGKPISARGLRDDNRFGPFGPRIM